MLTHFLCSPLPHPQATSSDGGRSVFSLPSATPSASAPRNRSSVLTAIQGSGVKQPGPVGGRARREPRLTRVLAKTYRGEAGTIRENRKNARGHRAEVGGRNGERTKAWRSAIQSRDTQLKTPSLKELNQRSAPGNGTLLCASRDGPRGEEEVPAEIELNPSGWNQTLHQGCLP